MMIFYVCKIKNYINKNEYILENLTNFFTILKSQIPYKISYLPQHCLYFLPEPHVHPFLVFIVLYDIYSIMRFTNDYKVWQCLVYMVHIVLLLLCVFHLLQTICKQCLHPFSKNPFSSSYI